MVLMFLSTASADNTTDSIFNSSKQSENKQLYSDDGMYF